VTNIDATACATRCRQYCALVIVGCALVIGGCAAPSLANIDLTRVGAAALPIDPATEKTIGMHIAATVAGRWPLLDEPELVDYVNLVGHTVAQQSVRGGEVEFRFGVLDTDEVNAFAAPGGYVLITRGALMLMESEAELAALLAHEIAHVDEEQVLDEIRRSDVLQTVRSEAQLTGPVLDQIAGAGASLLFTGLKREDELVADSVGLLYVTGAGYRPAALFQFLERLAAVEEAADEGGGGRFAELRSTHPPPGDRLAALRRQLEALGRDADVGAEQADRFRRFVRR
jgi:beta-barrel assembly-enhancing protease